MKKLVIISISIVILISLSCEKNNENRSVTTSVDCQSLTTGLLDYNKNIIKNEINKITTDLTPNSFENDSIGHKENFSILINKLNECNGITAEMLCYACIYTSPPQSELLVTIDSSGNKIKRVIDILTPADTVLSFQNVHDYHNKTKLEEINYKGCFVDNPAFKSRNDEHLTDTIFYEIKKDTLTLNLIMNYNCCGLLNDSLIIENEQINIYISDTCSEGPCRCRCMCDFEFVYKFTDFWQKNINFGVYLKELNDNKYEFWKETKFIDGLD